MNFHRNDPHNFGRKVKIFPGEKVLKPRNISGEFFLFSQEGPLREFLRAKLPSDYSPEALLPKIDFFSEPDSKPTLAYQEMSYLSLPGAPRPLTPEDYRRLGAVLALTQWLGIVDLHADNMFFGFTSEGNFVFSPSDLEMMFFDGPEYLLENSLFPSPVVRDGESVDPENYGLIHLVRLHRRFPPSENFLAMICQGIFSFFQGLNKYSEEFERILPRQPVRITLRKTIEYQEHLAGKKLVNLIPEEDEQLERGDIPYFFRVPESEGVFYWHSPEDFRPVQSLSFPRLKHRFSGDVTDLMRGLIMLFSMKSGPDFSSLDQDIAIVRRGPVVHLKAGERIQKLQVSNFPR